MQTQRPAGHLVLELIPLSGGSQTSSKMLLVNWPPMDHWVPPPLSLMSQFQ
jgi:hypothetical protein